MKILRPITKKICVKSSAAVLTASLLTSCGFFAQPDTPAGKTPAPGFSLTPKETTLVSVDELAGFLSSESFLVSLKLDNLAPEKPSVPAFSRVDSNDFARCVSAQLNAVPLRVTLDTLALEFDLDLIQLCDRAAQTTDAIKDVSNQVKGSFVLSCSGGNFAAFQGRTWGGLGTLSLASVCGSTSEISWAASQEVSARLLKSPPTTNSGDALQEDLLSVRKIRLQYSGAGTSPCRIKIDQTGSATDAGLFVRYCRKLGSSFTFDGPVSAEGRSPNAAEKPRPSVNQGQIVLKDVSFRQRDEWFHDSVTTFTYNNWTGSVTMSNGWAKPTWSATAEDGATATGIVGERMPRNGGSFNPGPAPRDSVSPPPPQDGREPSDGSLDTHDPVAPSEQPTVPVEPAI